MVSRALVPAIRESSEADPGSTHAEPTRSRLQPSETELPRNAKTQKKAQTKEIGMHPDARKLLTRCPELDREDPVSQVASTYESPDATLTGFVANLLAC